MVVVLEAALDKGFAGMTDVGRNVRDLVVAEGLGKGDDCAMLGLKNLGGPRVLARQHLNREAAKRPDVRLLPNFGLEGLWCHPGQSTIDKGLHALQALVRTKHE